MMRHYRVAGLVFASPVPLAVPAEAAVGPADVSVRIQPPAPVPSEPLAGELLQTLEFGNWGSWLVEQQASLKLRLAGFLEAEYGLAGNSMTVTPDPQLAEGMLEVMLAASLISPLLSLRGRTLLHASGIVVAGRLVSVIGPSGGGKTTIAAALVAGGGALLTDDLMPLEERDGELVTHRCATALRLRPDSVATGFIGDADTLSRSADERIVWQAPRIADEANYRPALFLIPELIDDGVPRVEHLAPQAALTLLLEHGKRSLGTRSRAWRVRDFHRLSRLAATTPVARLILPRDALHPQSLIELIAAVLRAP